MDARHNATILTLHKLCEAFYWQCHNAGLGDSCHSFLEFNGVLSKYVDLVRTAAEQGIDPAAVNVHSGPAIEAADHDIEYLAQKLACIFAPFMQTERTRDVLRRGLFGA